MAAIPAASNSITSSVPRSRLPARRIRIAKGNSKSANENGAIRPPLPLAGDADAPVCGN